MAIAPFRKLGGLEPMLSRVQDAVALVFAGLAREPLLNTSTVQAALTTSSQEVAHGLGRAPLGFIVARKDAQADVWEATSATPAKTLALKASAPVNTTLIFF